MKDLSVGKTSKVILQFAIPIFIGNFFNLAYNLADTRIIGYFLGNETLAAVGSVSTLSDLIIGFIIGLANGFSVITAQLYGMGKKDNIRKSFAMALFMGEIITIAIAVGCIVGLPKIFDLLNVMEVHKAQASEYISVIFYGLVFSTFYNILASNLRAIGDAYTPLFFLIISACFNVGLDILFVRFMEMGIRGTAIATVLSQVISAVICMVYTLIKYPFLRFGFSDFKPERNYILRMLPAGFSMALMSCLVSFGTVSLQTAINTLGENTIVAHAATRKLTSIFMMPFSALATTMATFCGQNYGAGKIDRIKKGIVSVLAMSYIWIIFVQIAAYTICPYLIVAVTATKISEVIETACLYQRVDTLFYAVPATISILRNSLQGMGDHSTPIFSSSLELAGKIIFALVFTPMLGYRAIIWAEPVVWIIMVIPLVCSILKRLKASEKRIQGGKV